MDSFEWLVKVLPQGSAVSAVLAVVALILLKYVPTLIKDFREIIREERDLFREELKGLREAFSDGIKDVTAAFTDRDEVLNIRIDGLTEAHRDLRDEVKGLKKRLEQ